ncbi:MAG: SEC-C domain-containing protein [Mariprofundaceae bacterium]|nr:SEC-C domain-containing protein [Mariprofundaceae bacterium]
MTVKTQRNEPCPCGSGKKYKKCCMLQKRERDVASLGRKEGVQLALSWLNKQHSEAIEAWVEDVWLKEISDEQRSGIASADARIRSIHDINLLEALLSEGSFAGVDGEANALKLVLTADDLNLDKAQRDYLKQLPSCALQLYQVTACQAGQSFSVRDALKDKAKAIVIADSYASRMFDVGDVVGLRLLKTPAGMETSGAIYHIPEAYVTGLKEVLLSAKPKERAKILIVNWLKLVAEHV